MNSGVRNQVSGLGCRVSGRRLGGVAGLVFAVLIMVAAVALLCFTPGSAAAGPSKTSTTEPHPVAHYSLTLFFEPNQGQTDAQVKFLARGSGYGLFLTANEAVLALQPGSNVHQRSTVGHQDSATSVIRMRLDGASKAARLSGAQPLPGKSNYFIGNDPKNWRTGIPQFARVNYESVYPGIDLAYYGNQGQLEYDFRVAPGADPNQIGLRFDGASMRLEQGALVLSAPSGDVRFHAPHIYQQVSGEKRAIQGSFRQLDQNRAGFDIGPYDPSRELIIDPVLTYSTYLGGTGTESLTRVAVDSGLNMYLAASTNSADFPVTDGSALKPGAQNLLIAKLSTDGTALVFATYLGSSGSDLLAGLAVDSSANIYVAGTTTSGAGDFPTTPNAFQQAPQPGTHGFLSKLSLSGGVYGLSYSTYLAGDGSDTVTGLTIGKKQQHAFVTGITTSRAEGTGFPSTTAAYQLCPFEPNSVLQNLTCTAGLTGPPQFFASEVNTTGSGTPSMLYSTFFGGNNPIGGETIGGGIAVDAAENIYFTGSTNLLGATGANGEHPLPLLSTSQQSCLNEAGLKTCQGGPGGTPGHLDAILVRINPSIIGAGGLVNSTYLGGSDDDSGNAVAVDSATNAYVTGVTFSNPWNVTSTGQSYAGGGDAFIAKIGTLSNSIYPLNFFRYLGGSGLDVGTDIQVDNVQASHVTGFTDSGDFPVSAGNNLPPGVPGTRDAFIALISTTAAAGDYAGLLGGGSLDQGSSIALNQNLDSSPAFVGGVTQSGNFPKGTQPPLQVSLAGPQDAFLAKIGSQSVFASDSTSSVNPNPGTVGNQITFSFVFDNTGPDPAANVIFVGALPSSGFNFSSASSSPGGNCPNPVGSLVTCNVSTVASGSKATITVVLIPTAGTTSLTVTPTISANGSAFVTPPNSVLTASVTDFTISADPKLVTITAGESTSFVIALAPNPSNGSYANAISVSHSTLPTGATGTFTSSSVTISGSTPATTTLNIATTARPVQSSRLHPGGPLYATWLPICGLSLLGLGAGLKHRRWLAGALLGLVVAFILWLPACGSSSSSTTPPSGGTPAGTYTITLTGTSGSDSHNIPVTLIVQ